MNFEFAPATREQLKARISIEGPSGSGKTWSALSIATGLGQRIAVIDTERRKSALYADRFAFQTLAMHSFDPRDLVKALAAAAAARFDVVIIDSLSHFWMGRDGMLEQVDNATKRSSSGSSFSSGWKDMRPVEREMIDAILAFPGHVIVTLRTKSEYVITEDDRGRKGPKKVGLKAEQREGLEYEFDIVGAIDLDHTYSISKSRMFDLADRVINKPGVELGAEILAWLSDGKVMPSVEDYIARAAAAATLEELRAVYDEVEARGIGAAPCTIDGRPVSLRSYVLDRRAALAPSEPPKPEAHDAPAQQPPRAPVPRQQRPQLASDDQKRDVAMLMGQKLGFIRREQRIAAVCNKFRRPIASFDELYAYEAEIVKKDLGPRPNYVAPREAALYEQLHEQLRTAPLDGIDPLMGWATEVRDAGQITTADWQQLSELADGRCKALLADQAAEGPAEPQQLAGVGA